jgi:4-aminobutyrate aminotransferase-like enzyme
MAQRNRLSFSVKSTPKNSRSVLELLRRFESRNVTFIEPDASWPIVWERAQGVHVWDVEGKRYLDLTAAFGVAAAGHANSRVVRAGQLQMARLLHAMGDVHPHALKVRLARELSRLTFEAWTRAKSKVQSPKSKVQSRTSVVGDSAFQARGERSSTAKTIFCNSGFEAVEAALKTAMLATGKPGVIVFEGAYHGLGYGALTVTHRSHFRSPFRNQLREFGHFVPFPAAGGIAGSSAASARDGDGGRLKTGAPLAAVEVKIRRLLRRERIGGILVEPIQVRGGINIPPRGLLPLLRKLSDEHGAVLIVDEVYTGFGRTGKWFACEHAGVIPDLICLGKALTGGFPLSACVGRADLMDAAWPPSTGEAIHTSTFLGHPVGCAMALAQIQEIEAHKLVARSAELGAFLLAALSNLVKRGSSFAWDVRGLGLLAGLELWRADSRPATELALSLLKALLHRGFILLPEGEHSNVLSFTPPLTISKGQLVSVVEALEELLPL